MTVDVPIKTKGVDRPGIEKIDDLRPLHHSAKLGFSLSHLVIRIPFLIATTSLESPRKNQKHPLQQNERKKPPKKNIDQEKMEEGYS